MIFRRRRTRIEIEHTTVRLTPGGVNFTAAQPFITTASAPSPSESAVARVLPLLEPKRTASAFIENDHRVAVTPEAPNAIQETLP